VNEKRTKLNPLGIAVRATRSTIGLLRLDWDVLRTPPCVAQICTVNRAQHIPLRFISNREKNGRLGPIRLGERQLAISNGTSVVLLIHGAILQTQQYKLLNGSRCAGCEGKKLSPPRQARPRQVDARAA
jgi:hypothetical protein